MSDDGQSISVAGMKWYTKSDLLSLDVDELSFAKKSRGRKLIDNDSRKIPTKLTRRQCVSKVAEVYDLTGKVMPIISSFKLDLHDLVKRNLSWDDCIPNELRSIWISNFDMMQELKHIKFKRAVVPDDAVNLEVNTLDFGDASKNMACSAIYARFLRYNGEYSCQLIFARSKIIPEGTSQPRAELIAAVLNTHTGEVIRKSFGSRFKSHVKLSDSQIVLHWLRNEDKPLKQWVRNRIIDIRRFTDPTDWYHVRSENMIADLGTRRGTTLKDIDPTSTWINGYEWMKFSVKDMPLTSLQELCLTKEDILEAKIEAPTLDITVHHSRSILNKEEVTKHYEYSNFIIDPNKYRFQVVARIIAYVLKFVKKLKMSISKHAEKYTTATIPLTEEEIKAGENYFFKKACKEVKNFNKKQWYSKFCEEKEEILWYTGRILPSESVSIVGRFTEAMKDLIPSTFCVPVVNKHSPIAYSIINDIHWYNENVSHRGSETVWREVLKTAYIIEGREIVKNFRNRCERCRYLRKKQIEVVMGPVSTFNLTIAPAFYITQVDLAGPFTAYSQHHKRTTVKVWLAVFCCCTTSTVSLKVMEDYSSTSFIQAFIRLSCDVGYPKILLPDEGSQLIKSCQNVRYNFKDVKEKLFVDSKVEFYPCPVGGHNMHGRVERKIREVKESIEKSFQSQRLSIIQWETVAAQISNSINDVPLALGNQTANFEVSDLITPNRLRLGRNNSRSPDGPLYVTNDNDKFLKLNQKIFDSWFEVWLLCHVPNLMTHPKWYKTTHNLQIGDIVLFIKHESSLQNKYQYGIVTSVNKDKDGVIRKAEVKYRNANEDCDRKSFRSVRDFVVIHGCDETSIMQELAEISRYVNLKFQKNCCE